MVDSLYYEAPCSVCGGFHNADDGSVNHNIKFSSDVLRTYLRKLYGADFDYSTDIEPTAWREVLRIINEATIEGLAQAQQPPTPEDHFYEQLRHSNEVFSAFKVHSMSQQLGDRLLDSNGKLKPFNKWLDEVKPIASHYVGPWLRTEYNTAVARAHYAADWKTFEANSDIFPNLQWMPTTSPNPDTEHRIFWENKLTRPIDDPFWDKHHPGDRWNCKCTLEPTDEPVTDIPKPEDREKAEPASGLKGNPAKTGQLFDKSHPYFPKNCKQCAFNKRKMSITNWFKNEQGDCNRCKGVKILRNLPIKELRNEVIKNRLLPTNDNISDYSNLQEKKVKLSLAALKRTMKHVYNYEMYEALQFAWGNIHVLKFDRKSNLGENKDLDTPQATNNIIKKRRRGVDYYNVYTFNFRRKKWEIKMEKNKDGYEQPYSINKKRS